MLVGDRVGERNPLTSVFGRLQGGCSSAVTRLRALGPEWMRGTHMESATLASRDWLLLFIDHEALNVDGPPDLDPVRVQKGMFLLDQRGPTAARHLYEFHPYNWGPFSSELYGDLDYLAFSGLIEVTRVPGRTWKRYAVTDKGHVRALSLARQVHPPDLRWVGRARMFVTTRTFAELLRDIYATFPEFTSSSLFRG